MKNSKLDQLVSLILEQINTTQQPQEMDIDEMANIKFEREKLPEPMRIPISQVRGIPSGKEIKTLEPDSKEFNTEQIVSDSILRMPGGQRVLEFRNYAEPYKDQRQMYTTRYYVIDGSKAGYYLGAVPQTPEYGNPRKRIDWEAGPPEGISPEDKDAWYKEKEKWNEAYAKRYAVFRAVDRFFDRQDILDLLDSALIPETWANPRTTERTTNVKKDFHFGGNDRSMMFEFHAVRDYADPEDAIENMFKTRVAIEDAQERERTKSVPMPRQFVSKGKWGYLQRIADENDFDAAGKYTPILDLFKKNIQEGQKGVVIRSSLIIRGNVVDNEYQISAEFSSKLGHRIPGIEVKARELTDITPTIRTLINKPLPEGAINNPNFTIRKYPTFFFGKEDGSGIMTELMNNLGDEMKNLINPEEVLNKIEGLMEFKPENIQETFIPGKKIKITEEQLKRVVNVIKEQQFDDAITKYQKEKEHEVFMTRDQAETLVSLASNWCQGKEGSPDCNEVLRIRSKFNLD